MNRNIRKVRIRNNYNGYSLFFIRPRHITNAHKSAKELMQVKHVKEVMVTSGRYGFVVKCPSELEHERQVSNYIKKRYGKVAKLECHYQYIR